MSKLFLIFCSKQELSMLLPNPLLSSARPTHHSVLDALSAGLVLWYHLMWSMRSSAHLNCLLHSKQLFASSVPNSTRWLLFCYSKVWHSSFSQETVILSLAMSALSLLSALSNVMRPSTNIACTSSAFSSTSFLSPRTAWN